MVDTSLVSGRRHDLLEVAPAAWQEALDASPMAAGLPFACGWADRRWPVILRRHAEAEDRELIPIGLPLPPGAGRHRVALLLPPAAILGVRRPPSLHAAAGLANIAWRPAIDALLELGGRYRIEPAVIGSLMWQHVTGLPYLTPGSDLDLLWPVERLRDIPPLLDGIARAQRAAPFRIDGEVILPDAVAVNWRELWDAGRSAGAAEVLGKSLDGVRLIARTSIYPVGAAA